MAKEDLKNKDIPRTTSTCARKDGYSSPPCYAHEWDAAFNGPAPFSARELSDLLDALLGAERTGVEIITAYTQNRGLDFAEAKLDVLQACDLVIRRGVLPREGEHVGRHVDADHTARRADLGAGQEDIEAAAAAEVEDHLTGLQGGDGRGVATGEAHVRPLGEGTEFHGIVADAGGQSGDIERAAAT